MSIDPTAQAAIHAFKLYLAQNEIVSAEQFAVLAKSFWDDLDVSVPAGMESVLYSGVGEAAENCVESSPNSIRLDDTPSGQFLSEVVDQAGMRTDLFPTDPITTHMAKPAADLIFDARETLFGLHPES